MHVAVTGVISGWSTPCLVHSRDMDTMLGALRDCLLNIDKDVMYLRKRNVRGSSSGVGHCSKGLRYLFIIVYCCFILNIATSRNERIDVLFHCLKQSLNADGRPKFKPLSGYKRVTPPRVVIDRNNTFVRKFILSISILTAQLWLCCLIINCGDIETNPGPSTGTDTSPQSLSSSYSSLSLPYDTHFTICHLNIQSLLPKVDLLQHEMQPFDVFVLRIKNNEFQGAVQMR